MASLLRTYRRAQEREYYSRTLTRDQRRKRTEILKRKALAKAVNKG